jgi:hypothetical protein
MIGMKQLNKKRQKPVTSSSHFVHTKLLLHTISRHVVPWPYLPREVSRNELRKSSRGTPFCAHCIALSASVENCTDTESLPEHKAFPAGIITGHFIYGTVVP